MKFFLCALASIIVVGGLSGFVAAFVVGTSWDTDSWGVNQWGSVAAWVSGLLTVIAVSISWGQVIITRKDADRRQQEQFDQNGAHRQIDTIAPIWKAIGDADVPILKVTNLMDEVDYLNKKYDTDIRRSADTDQVELDIEDAKKRLREQFKDTAKYIMAAEVSFTNAMMIVEQPNVRAELSKLKDDYSTLSKTYAKLLTRAIETKSYEYSDLTDAKSAINKRRETMVEVVRENLVRPTRTKK